ncbi:hypothetical protein H0O00_02730 [Candidatus Micrarchaeota archaeon]|nr:hypothetical protein [Candidatus Micrarchaeota archaeon]
MVEKKKEEKIVITPELRKTWIRVRSAWGMSFEAFNSTVSMLDKKHAEGLYDLVRHSLFKDNYAEILRGNPELREVLKNEEDRLCMHDIYEILSWKLGKSEPLPKEIRAREAMKGPIGRASPELRF